MIIYNLFEFVYSDAVTYRYTSADRAIVYGGNTFSPFAISRTEVENAVDVFKTNLTITFPQNSSLAKNILQNNAEDSVSVTIYEQQDATTTVIWKGRVIYASANESLINLECESIFTSLKRTGLKERYQKNCRHILYQRGCLLNREDFLITGVVASIDSTNLIIEIDPDVDATYDALAADYFIGGIMFRTADSNVRYITDHNGRFLTINRPFLSLTVSTALKLYPGCDKTKSTCLNKFNNLDNYGGQPFIPTKNPFRSSSIV